jgi:imidazolonepropionase-like amidohydrolase
MGTDAGTEGNDHGTNAGELAFMVENGMSEIDAIIASTVSCAELLDVAD